MKKTKKTYFEKYMTGLTSLEQYVQYCLRCLHRVNIYPQPTDFTLITIERKNGQIAEAVVYPATAVKNGTVANPLFFKGFKMDYDFKDLTDPIQLTITENYKELIE